VPGYHVHFVSADRNGGGHLLHCRGANLRLQIQRESDVRIALPETEDFFKADCAGIRPRISPKQKEKKSEHTHSCQPAGRW
jgi:alpha-acetolactate decarboxylase